MDRWMDEWSEPITRPSFAKVTLVIIVQNMNKNERRVGVTSHKTDLAVDGKRPLTL